MGAVEVNGYTIKPGADLVAANLAGANLSRAHLRGANLKMAHLFQADLRGANLTAADLTAAAADQYTTWPKGFDPEAAGVIVEERLAPTATGVEQPDTP